ncbi:FAD-dependent oxidoreductase [Falsiroseomonas bella]|uniref:FAD-dependent oxidoreductase n=1 Tax=Falsiroseomonas bella TaxID=2184016 RepID=A0A317F9L3_9PROT|nr:FAD-dependent oxidoreductase [Falsiroseomonas bella]PWS35744.1 FAD-dependent oxidoreductase [Falsiroseomonas bella]
MTDDAVFAPGFATTPWWWEDAPPPTPAPPSLPDAAEVAIIGGGIAGLACALELGRAGVPALVMDREAIGWGASSRNGGALSGAGSLGRAKSDVAKGLDPKLLAEMVEEAEASFDALDALIAREGIDCAWRRCGRFVGAHTEAAMATLAKRAALLNAADPGGAELLPRARLAEELGTTRYHGGLRIARAGGLHPARYVQGLAKAAQRAGAMLAGGVAVQGIARDGAGFVLATAAGAVRARHVMVATNGYTGRATPWHRRRVIPVASYMIATEELGADRVRALLPQGRVYGDTKKILYYFRPSPDGTRILFGGRATLSDTDPRIGARWLHRQLVNLFPQLEGVRITHGWKGNVAFAFDMLPHVGVQDGVHFALGCNGSGVTTMTHLGTVAARMMLGGDNRISAFARLPMPTIPGYTGTPWFMQLVTGWYRLKDRRDGWSV